MSGFGDVEVVAIGCEGSNHDGAVRCGEVIIRTLQDPLRATVTIKASRSVEMPVLGEYIEELLS